MVEVGIELPAIHQQTERLSAIGPELHPVLDLGSQEPEVVWDLACVGPLKARRRHLTLRMDPDSLHLQIYAAP